MRLLELHGKYLGHWSLTF